MLENPVLGVELRRTSSDERLVRVVWVYKNKCHSPGCSGESSADCAVLNKGKPYLSTAK